MEDFVTWVDTSKLKRTIMQYNDEVRFNLFYFHSGLTPVNSWTISIFYNKKEKFILKTKPMALKSISCYYSRRKPGMDGHHIPENKGHQALLLAPHFFAYVYDLCHHQNFIHESALRRVSFC
jgi:hypothetical protein